MTLQVLVVEDDADCIEATTCILEKYQIEFCVAQNGQEALQILQEAKKDIDVVLLDVMMPNMSGFEFLEEARKKHLLFRHKEEYGEYPIPVIMTSARNTMDDFMTGMRLGAVDYLIKPFDPYELLKRMSQRVYK